MMEEEKAPLREQLNKIKDRIGDNADIQSLLSALNTSQYLKYRAGILEYISKNK